MLKRVIKIIKTPDAGMGNAALTRIIVTFVISAFILTFCDLSKKPEVTSPAKALYEERYGKDAK